MQTAPGSKVASPCWVWAKSITLPPGRTASIAVLMSALPPTARMTASAPRPSVSAKTRSTTFSAAGVDGILEAEAGGDGVALGIEIGGEHACAGAAGEDGVHQADGSLADDQHRIVGGEIEQLYALEHGVHRLDEGGLLEWNAVGNAHHAAARGDEVHHADVLGKAAAGGLKAGGDAGLLVERALRGRAFAAVVALAAGNVVVKDIPGRHRGSR